MQPGESAGGCCIDLPSGCSRSDLDLVMIVVVAFNFRAVDRDQQFLMPPSMAEWLPEDHLAWFVIDVVDELDLAGFDEPYRRGAVEPPDRASLSRGRGVPGGCGQSAS
jgi:hypothetical protein